jgi:hypothetical protein
MRIVRSHAARPLIATLLLAMVTLSLAAGSAFAAAP